MVSVAMVSTTFFAAFIAVNADESAVCSGNACDNSADEETHAMKSSLLQFQHRKEEYEGGCAHGYDLAFRGYWSNHGDALPYWLNLGLKYDSAACASQCGSGCAAYSLYGNENCYTYDYVANAQHTGNSIACVKRKTGASCHCDHGKGRYVDVNGAHSCVCHSCNSGYRLTKSKTCVRRRDDRRRAPHPTHSGLCGDGFELAFRGYWYNHGDALPDWLNLGQPFDSAACASNCGSGCAAYSLYGNKNCYTYENVGRRQDDGNSIACVKRKIGASCHCDHGKGRYVDVNGALSCVCHSCNSKYRLTKSKTCVRRRDDRRRAPHPTHSGLCGDGFELAFRGYWYNHAAALPDWLNLGQPFDSAACASQCGSGCAAYSLYGNKNCYTYENVGRRQYDGNSIACVRKKSQDNMFGENYRS